MALLSVSTLLEILDYVKQMLIPYATYKNGSDCVVEKVSTKNKYVSVIEVELTLDGDLHHEYWHEIRFANRGRFAALIPVSVSTLLEILGRSLVSQRILEVHILGFNPS